MNAFMDRFFIVRSFLKKEYLLGNTRRGKIMRQRGKKKKASGEERRGKGRWGTKHLKIRSTSCTGGGRTCGCTGTGKCQDVYRGQGRILDAFLYYFLPYCLKT